MAVYISTLTAVLNAAKKNDEKITSLGAHLYGHTPHIAPEAWLHSTFIPLDNDQCRAIEAAIRRTLPQEFEEFLRQTNGLKLFSQSISIYGTRLHLGREGDAAWQPFPIEPPNTIERPGGAKDSYIFVGSYFDDGSKLALDSETHRVVRLPKGNGRVILNEWNSFDDMLSTEIVRLSKLFNAEGRMIDENATTLP